MSTATTETQFDISEAIRLANDALGTYKGIRADLRGASNKANDRRTELTGHRSARIQQIALAILPTTSAVEGASNTLGYPELRNLWTRQQETLAAAKEALAANDANEHFLNAGTERGAIEGELQKANAQADELRGELAEFDEDEELQWLLANPKPEGLFATGWDWIKDHTDDDPADRASRLADMAEKFGTEDVATIMRQREACAAELKEVSEHIAEFNTRLSVIDSLQANHERLAAEIENFDATALAELQNSVASYLGGADFVSLSGKLGAEVSQPLLELIAIDAKIAAIDNSLKGIDSRIEVADAQIDSIEEVSAKWTRAKRSKRAHYIGADPTPWLATAPNRMRADTTTYVSAYDPFLDNLIMWNNLQLLQAQLSAGQPVAIVQDLPEIRVDETPVNITDLAAPSVDASAFDFGAAAQADYTSAVENSGSEYYGSGGGSLDTSPSYDAGTGSGYSGHSGGGDSGGGWSWGGGGSHDSGGGGYSGGGDSGGGGYSGGGDSGGGGGGGD